MENKVRKISSYGILHMLFVGSMVIHMMACRGDIKPVAEHKTADKTEVENTPANEEVKGNTEEAVKEGDKSPAKKRSDIPANWKEITVKDGFVLDIKYATADNFTHKQIYDCGRCFLRPEAAEKLVKIHQELRDKLGYGIKVFDCFRPKPYQQRLWDVVPDPDYVTPPAKGSMHSRGLAVDLTIVDNKGQELDMGTPYDFFGKEAHQDYTGHSDKVNKNRALLKAIMEKYGFASIRTEWWHFSYSARSYPLDAWVWDCSNLNVE